MSHSAEAEGAGLLARVRSLVGGLLEILETRLELVGADIELQAERLRRIAILLLAGLLFLALALVFGSVLVIAAFWDTHRLAAIAAVGAVHLAAGIGCLLWLRRLVRAGPRPFDATIAELRQDIARLR
ncbi:MAG: phage holin family protein [Burkholderiaceae bacterium]